MPTVILNFFTPSLFQVLHTVVHIAPRCLVVLVHTECFLVRARLRLLKPCAMLRQLVPLIKGV